MSMLIQLFNPEVLDILVRSSLFLLIVLLVNYIVRFFSYSASLRDRINRFALSGLFLIPLFSLCTGPLIIHLPDKLLRTGDGSSILALLVTERSEEIHVGEFNGSGSILPDTFEHLGDKGGGQWRKGIFTSSGLVLWLVGFGPFFMMFVRDNMALRRLHRQSERLTAPHIVQLLSQIARTRNTRSSSWSAPAVFVSRRIVTPMTGGFLKPAIYIPPEMLSWPVSKLRSVLLHEYGHIVRSDNFYRTITRLFLLLYWFHPLMWFYYRLSENDQEKACDESVILHGEKRSDYAFRLMELSQYYLSGLRQPEVMSAHFMKRSKVEERIYAILRFNPHKKEGMMRIYMVAIILLTLGLTGVHIVFSADSTGSFTLNHHANGAFNNNTWSHFNGELFPAVGGKTIHYETEGRRDPFVSLFAAQPVGPVPEGIEGMTLSEIILVGIIKWGEEGYQALFEGTDDKLYTCKVGDSVRYAKIVSITAKTVLFEKRVPGPFMEDRPPQIVERSLFPQKNTR